MMEKYRGIFGLGRLSDATPVDIANGALFDAKESLEELKELIKKSGAKDMASDYFYRLLDGDAETGTLNAHMEHVAKIIRDGETVLPADAFLFDFYLCSVTRDEATLAYEEGDINGAWVEAVRTVVFSVQAKGHLDFALGLASPAKLLAERRHAESRALVEEAIDHWKNNIDPSLSAQKAATELVRVVPLSHKKLAEVISKERNKIFKKK